jgi:hypothetical protein
MAHALFHPFAGSAPSEAVRKPALLKRMFDAFVAAQMRRAAREIARVRPFIDETALVHGPYRRVGGSEAERLPFTR